jgi:NAD(P)-dependent dehydrogenase (short-subunit alcohol dehydrogenase family)
MTLHGRHVCVTGGTGALGSGVVEVLRARGATIHVPPAPPAGPALDQEDAAVAYFASLPPLWASVHLVGGFAMGGIAETSFATFEQQWRINTATCFLACREAVKSIRRAGRGGRIVNVAARPVLAPVANMVAYTSAKAGVAAITQALAAEVLGEGILVNAVVPSIIDTPANRAAMPAADHATWPTPAELAAAVAFLVTPENALTSGVLVPVYGRA